MDPSGVEGDVGTSMGMSEGCSASSDDVGRNPRGRSFTFGEDPYEEHEERAEEHEGNHGGK